MKAKGCNVYLYGNDPGFTLPSNIGELGDDITTLGLSSCSLRGAPLPIIPPPPEANREFRSQSRTGGLPPELGLLTNFQKLDVSWNNCSGAG